MTHEIRSVTARTLRRRLLAVLLALLATAPLLVQAQPAPPRPSILRFMPMTPTPIGKRADVALHLTNTEGVPQSNKVLVVSLEGEQLRRVRTDDNGVASVRVNHDLTVGSYELKAEFIGTQDYLPTEARATLVIRPALVTVQTVPPQPGIAFTLGGRSFHSGPDGLARIEVSEPGDYELMLHLEDQTLIAPGIRASFARWQDAVFTPERTVTVDRDVALQLGLELFHPVRTTFRDLGDRPVEWSRVASVTLKASNAVYRTVLGPDPIWLQANRIMRAKTGIYRTPLLWSVESVMIDGTNVVNRYQQRFFVEPGKDWDLQLLLYHATFRAKDAVFGYALGEGVAVTYPDGRQEQLTFGEDQAVHLYNLARGLYKVQVTGASGVAPPTPVALSRDQDVDLKVLSTVDIVTGVSVGLTLALGLLLIGRPQLFGLRRRPRMPPTPAGQPLTAARGPEAPR